MIIDSVNTDAIQMIKASKITDGLNRTFYKVSAQTIQTIDLKSFRDKHAAQDYLRELADKVQVEGAEHIVVVSEL